MSVELLGILATLLVTLFGWIYTARKQREILEITRKHSVADRELSAIRKSMTVVAEINGSLHAIAFELRWLGQYEGGHIKRDGLNGLIRETEEKMTQFRALKSDANYVWLRKQLSEASNNRIDDAEEELKQVVESLGTRIESEGLTDEEVGRHAPEWFGKLADAFVAVAETIGDVFGDYLTSVAKID